MAIEQQEQCPNTFRYYGAECWTVRHVWCQGSLLARSTTRGTMEVRDLEPLSRVLQVGETRRTQVSLSSIECCFVFFLLSTFYLSTKNG